MAFVQQGEFSFKHVNQPDNLSSVMNADQIKAAFDSQAGELKTTLNNLIVALGSVTVGNSGGRNIGIETIAGVTGNNLLTVLTSLKSQIDTKLGTAGGNLTGNISVTGTINATGNINTAADVGAVIFWEDGTRLSNKYFSLTGGTVTGPTTINDILTVKNQVVSDPANANAILVAKSLTDSGSIRLMTTEFGYNMISSANYNNTVSKDLRITGSLGDFLSKLDLYVDNTAFLGNVSIGRFNLNFDTVNIKWAENVAIECDGYFRLKGSDPTLGKEFQTQRTISASIYRSTMGVDSSGNMSLQNVDFTTGSSVGKARLLLKNDNTIDFPSPTTEIKLQGQVIASTNAGTTLYSNAGGHLLGNATTINPSIPLDKCPNGWILEWQPYPAGSVIKHFTYINKNGSPSNWHSFIIPHPTSRTGTKSNYVTKLLSVGNSFINGHTDNTAAPNGDVALFNIYAY